MVGIITARTTYGFRVELMRSILEHVCYTLGISERHKTKSSAQHQMQHMNRDWTYFFLFLSRLLLLLSIITSVW